MTLIAGSSIQAIHKIAALSAQEIVAEGMEVEPQLLMFKVEEVDGVQFGALIGMVDPRFVHSMQRDANTKDLLLQVVRGLLTGEVEKIVPDVIVHVSESWMKEAANEAELKQIESGLLNVKDLPGRTEAVTILLHTLDGSYLSVLPIINLGGGRRELPVVPLDLASIHNSFGRLSLNKEKT